MNTWKFYAVLAGGLVAWSGAMHWSGRLTAAKNCEKRFAEAANDAVKEDQTDREGQIDAGRVSAEELADEIARLRRQLKDIDNAQIDDGRTCLGPDDGQRVLDDHDEIFEAGLHP